MADDLRFLVQKWGLVDGDLAEPGAAVDDLVSVACLMNQRSQCSPSHCLGGVDGLRRDVAVDDAVMKHGDHCLGTVDGHWQEGAAAYLATM